MAKRAQDDQRLCLGVVVGTHGVRGVVKIKPFTENPLDVGAYGPLSDESGQRSYQLTVHGVHKGSLLAGLSGVDNREAAQALKGLRLHVDRSALPAIDEEDAFYYADLLGLRVEGADGTAYGTVTHVDDHGAGDVIEVTDARGKIRVWPFTKEVVPTVDLANGRLLVDPPSEVGEPEQGEAAEIGPDDLETGGNTG
ncbi:ribosome maturation factor RimM [Rhodovibrio salinarum]|uniref:Ribosome maturation factor RimM n=1 Tax=Rhodovibrio salinarum TaxID=1087 RepID=A0A934UZT8_9PROT|nr:ribosome maturation factor RimM [Rhodovibrio salinarum]MBK1697093.1 16S rRNA processing protein RimM [Rhodovibrio salinarum]